MHERLECDIIMRGGATSGMVYPGAVATLAEKYDFRQIGGASAGAIAAGITAAAQFGRANNPRVFETVIRTIPKQLGGGTGKTGLRRLFTPTPSLSWLFECVSLLAQGKTRSGLALLLLPMLLAGILLTLALVVGVHLALGGTFAQMATLPLLWLFALIASGIILAVVLLALVVRWQMRLLAANGFGFGTGVNPKLSRTGLTAEQVRDRMAREGYLSDWLHAMIQKGAGLPVDQPLTMGHLWGGSPDIGPWDGNGQGKPRQIDLILTTTNLSQQLPHQFPFLERVQSHLYFRREDLAAVLPPMVVAWMAAHADARWTLERDGVTYLRLPPVRKLPVLLGVRMSLSFPGLVAAVKLHETCRWEPGGKRDADERKRATANLRPCWFSDGGITSNFPVTAFDAPLPGRPTFCINLADIDPQNPPGPDARHRVRMPRDNSDMIRAPHVARIEEGGILTFVSAIVAAARNGQENGLQTVPGQRDRIATVLLNPKAEGGLNLDMDGATIEKLSGYGDEVGRQFIRRFHPDGGGDPEALNMNWANHRWLRFRSTVAGLETLLVRFDHGFHLRAGKQEAYQDMLGRWPLKANYGWELVVARKAAMAQGQALAGFARQFASQPVTDWKRAGADARPAGTIFNGRRRDSRDRDSLSRDHNAPMPPMAWQLMPVSRDPWRC